jgi:hypothetical protein
MSHLIGRGLKSIGWHVRQGKQNLKVTDSLCHQATDCCLAVHEHNLLKQGPTPNNHLAFQDTKTSPEVRKDAGEQKGAPKLSIFGLKT